MKKEISKKSEPLDKTEQMVKDAVLGKIAVTDDEKKLAIEIEEASKMGYEITIPFN